MLAGEQFDERVNGPGAAFERSSTADAGHEPAAVYALHVATLNSSRSLRSVDAFREQFQFRSLKGGNGNCNEERFLGTVRNCWELLVFMTPPAPQHRPA